MSSFKAVVPVAKVIIGAVIRGFFTCFTILPLSVDMWVYTQIDAHGTCPANIINIEGLYAQAAAQKTWQTDITDVEMFWPLFYQWKAAMPIYKTIVAAVLCLIVLVFPQVICDARDSFTKRAPMRRQVADVATAVGLILMIGLAIYISPFEAKFASSCVNWHSECSTAGHDLLVLHMVPLCCQIWLFVMDIVKFSANAELARMVDEHGQEKSAKSLPSQLPTLLTKIAGNGKSSKLA